MSGLRKAVPWTVGAGGLVQQMTSGDIAVAQSQNLWNNWNGTTKAKFVVHNLISRFTFGSFSPITDFGAPPKPSLNIGNVFNKWTGLGAAALLYGHAPWRLPEKGMAKKVAVAGLFAGIIGGLLDDPATRATGQRPQGAFQANQGMPSARGNAMIVAGGSGGNSVV